MQLRLYSVLIAGVSLAVAGSAVLAQRPIRQHVLTLAQNVLPPSAVDDVSDQANQAVTSADFADRIGVNTHIHYTDGGYANVEKTLGALKFLGVKNLRDSVPDPSLPGGGGLNFGKFAQAGLKFDFVVAPNLPLETTLSLLENFVQAHPGSITAIEGPNEVNNWPVTYKGETGPKAALAYQSDLYDAVKSSSLLKAIPVYNLTSWPELIGRFDAYNAHTYPPKGEQPEAHVRNVVNNLAKLDQKSEAVITEVGYYTLPGKGSWGGVDDVTQAKLSLNLILDSVRSGIKKIYLYQLLDAYPDPTSSEMEKHFGLFDIDYRPKPAASAIRALIQATSQKPQGAATGQRQAPVLSITSGSVPVKRLLVDGEQANSTLILWDERPIWDSEKNVPIPVAPSEVTVESDSAFGHAEVIDPLKGADPAQTLQKTRSIKVQLEGYPVLIKLHRD